MPPPPPGVETARCATVRLHRTRAIERGATVLVGIAGALAVLAVPVSWSVRGDAQAYLDGDLDDTEFIEAIAPSALMSLVQLLSVVAAAVVVIVWMYRIAANHRTLGRDTTWGPGWAIAGWFLPPLLFVIPFLMLREMWKAADPDAGDDWTSSGVSPLVPVWFACYSLVPIALLLLGGGMGLSDFGGSEEHLAEELTGGRAAGVVSALVAAAGAGVFIVMAARLGVRHRRFTGEERA